MRKRIFSFLLAWVLVLGLVPWAQAATLTDGKVLADEATQWHYLDNGTDPAGDSGQIGYDRRSWTRADYDDSGWKTGAGPFGAYLGQLEHSEGNPVTSLLDGTREEAEKEESTPTYFFRTTVELTEEDLAGMNRIQGHVIFDDAVIVYINGQEVAQHFTLDYGENVAFGSERGRDTVLEGDILCADPASLLHVGENVIAVELHQDINSTERAYLKLDLSLSGEELPLEQKDIGLYVGRDESEMNFSWYSNSREDGVVRIAEESELVDGVLPEDATVVSAQKMTSYQAGYYSYQATATGLEPGTKYAYQLCNGELESEVYEFTTADSGAFSFAFAADPQLKSADHGVAWANTLDQVANAEAFEDTAFLLVAGDQVDDNHSEQAYDWYFNNDVLPELPQATLIGNHDSGCRSFEMHFNLPNESDQYGTDASGSGDYYFVYHNVLFLVLNSQNTDYEGHAAFLRQAVEETEDLDIQWKVAAFHHSIFSVAQHSLEQITMERRAALTPVFRELDVDVVFMGHDHAYTRTYMMDGMVPNLDEDYIYGNGMDEAPTAVMDPEGILYITGNCASTRKFYEIQDETFDFSAVQNQENQPNISRVDVSDNAFTVTTYRTEDMSVVDTFTIYRSAQVNTDSDTGLVDYLGSYATGDTDADGGVAEIVTFNPEKDRMYLVSGKTQTLDIVDIGSDGQTKLYNRIRLSQLAYEMFNAGDMTSVDYSFAREQLAIAVQHSDYTQNGTICITNADGNWVAQYEAGVQPDMVTFSPDGRYILTANEGEPREGYESTDPKGSVTLVDLETQTARTIDFTALDERREELVELGVLLKPGAAPSVDLEPEYIAVSSDSKTAYVTLQENNAIAALDLETGTWKSVKGLGFKDHSKEGNGLDLNKDGQILIQNEDVYGVYMPDGIAAVTIDGEDYLLTANEGDAREWGEYVNVEDRTVNGSKKVEVLTADAFDGLEEGKTYLLGGRSFSVWDAQSLSSWDGGTVTQVYDSGDGFEQVTARVFPDYFNSGHDETELDGRSRKKGPEPESVEVLEANGKTYAVVGLERIGGIMLYDISNPSQAKYADYLNVRAFDPDNQLPLSEQGDLGAEGICTIEAADSPTGRALILVANEISGTVTVAEVEPRSSGGNGGSSSSGSSSNVTTETVTNPDGSETTIVTNQTTGVVTETTKYPDGSTLVEETEKDGTVTTTRTLANGVETVTRDEPGEQVTVEVTLPRGVESATVTLPVEAGAGMVAIDTGTGEAVILSVPTEDGIAVKLTRSANLVIRDNATDFADITGSWAKEAIDFATAHGLFSGTSEITFQPGLQMTRGMLMTVLARFDGQDTTGGATWYEKGMEWARANGVSDGNYPDSPITREQLVTMLYRYAGRPAADGSLSRFADSGMVSSYALDAMIWAVQTGILNGMGDGTLNPQGYATRAEVAAILMRFTEYLTLG